MKRFVTLFCAVVLLALCVPAGAQTLSTNNVIFNLGDIVGRSSQFVSVKIGTVQPLIVNGRSYSANPPALTIANDSAQITNNYVIFTNLVCGPACVVTIADSYSTTTTNFTINNTNFMDASGNVIGLFYIGPFVPGIGQFYANTITTNFTVGGSNSGTNSYSTNALAAVYLVGSATAPTTNFVAVNGITDTNRVTGAYTIIKGGDYLTTNVTSGAYTHADTNGNMRASGIITANGGLTVAGTTFPSIDAINNARFSSISNFNGSFGVDLFGNVNATSFAGSVGVSNLVGQIPAAQVAGGAITNVPVTVPIYNASYLQAMTNSFLPPLQLCDYDGSSNYRFPSFRNNEWYFNEADSADVFDWTLVCFPTNATTCTIDFWAHTLSGTGTPALQVWTSGGSNPSNTNLSLTTTPAHFNWTFATVQNMGLCFRANGVKWAVSNNITMSYSPGPSNVVLQSSFVRYAIRMNNLSAGGLGSRNQGGAIYIPYSANRPDYSVCAAPTHSFCDFQTDARNITLEIFAGNGGAWLSYYVNGIFRTNILYQGNGSIGHMQFQDLTLPTNQPVNTVRVVAAYQSDGYGSWMARGIYVPATNSVTFNFDNRVRTIAFIGDSILSGVNSTNGGVLNDCWKILENTWPFRCYGTTASGATLKFSWASTNGYANKLDLIDSIKSQKPDLIWINLGFNDGNTDSFAGTNGFYVAYLDMVDTLHDQIPSAQFVCQGLTYTTATFPNKSVADYRTNILAVANLRTNYCVYANVENLGSTAGDQADGVHFGEGGTIKYANFIGGFAITNRIVVRK